MNIYSYDKMNFELLTKMDMKRRHQKKTTDLKLNVLTVFKE